MNLKTKLAKNYTNFRGWKTKRKIVVIESDDWGSIRMPSQEAVSLLKSKKYPLENNKFTLFDGLERFEDLEELFRVLKQFKDINNNYPVITACAVVANPNFDKIRASGFKEYFPELLAETYKTYGEEELLNLWIKEGIANNLLFPQFHGREHLNVRKWLKVLQSNNQMEHDAFDSKTLLGLSGGMTPKEHLYMASFEAATIEHKNEVKEIIKQGLEIFEQTFGFKSRSFMPNQSKIFQELSEVLYSNGVKFSQAGQFLMPSEKGNYKLINKFWGDTDEYGMKYWRRNCTFEPYKNLGSEVENCIKEMEIAFRWNKPAVINSHRINFTSRVNVSLRDESLDKLSLLLSRILKKWPDVEFMNSSSLANVMLNQEIK